MTGTMSEQERNEKFLELVGPHYQGFFAYARYLSGTLEGAEDLIQNASLNGLKYLHQLKEDSKFKSWFYRIIHNTFRNQNRRQEYRKTSFVEDDVLQGYVNKDGGTGDISKKIVDSIDLENALMQLTPQLRETLLLFEREGFSIAEISTMMKRSQSAIKHRLRTARDQLRIHYFSGKVPDRIAKKQNKEAIVDKS